MLLFPYVEVARATEPAPTVDALVALPDHAARTTALTTFLASGSSDADAVASASVALAVVGQLAANNRTDPSVVRMFLAAALSSDPSLRAAALTAAAANGDPPVAPPAPAPTAGLDPNRIRAYRARYLHTGPLNLVRWGATSFGDVWVPYSTTQSGWAVYQNGDALRVPALATALSDQALLDHMDRRNRQATVAAIAGWTGVGGGFAAMLAALEVDDLDTSLALIGGGSAVAIGASLPAMAPFFNRQKRTWAGKFYEQADINARIDTYNQALQQELGLSDAEVVEAESGD
jgi:hypothetical protein